VIVLTVVGVAAVAVAAVAVAVVGVEMEVAVATNSAFFSAARASSLFPSPALASALTMASLTTTAT
jgi:hypothetical protein